MTVRNGDDIVEAYQLEVVGAPAGWATIEPAQLTLYPGTTAQAVVVFTPPRSSQVPAGEMPFGVRVVPAEHPEATIVEEGLLTIEPFVQVEAAVRPDSRTGLRRGVYRVDLTNYGNVTEEVSIAAADPTDRLNLTVREPIGYLPPGSTAEHRVVARSRRWLWWGQPRQLPFVVEVADPQGAGQVMPATFVQRPVISPALLKILAALLALLLLLLLLWFKLLRPAVRTAARQAANEAVASPAQPNTAVQTPPVEPSTAAGGAGRSAGAGGNNGAGGGGTGGQGGPDAANPQFSTSIQVKPRPGATDTKSFKVDQGKEFAITDVVVDNPQGDEGMLRVTANAVTVVNLGLENHRNWDYHTVTPIRIPGNAQLSVTVACRKAGSPPDAPAPTTCADEVHVNGIMRTVATP